MRTQRSLGVLYLVAALSGACSDRNDDDLPIDMGQDPSSTPDAGQPNPGQPDATLPAIDGSTLLDANIEVPQRDASAPDAAQPVAERVQDTRKFSYDPAMQSPFEALPGVETDRFAGVLDGAGYRIEVPKDWNGMLVMYAHGYAGEGAALRVTTPSIRAHLLANKYAWAASSYSTNFYDVRAGVEDTNKLALAFTRIAAENGRTLAEPTKRYIVGHSMGGHIAGAAVEREAIVTARSRVVYDAALPMCGVMGDTELFDYFTAYQVAAHQVAGMPLTGAPIADYPTVRMQIRDALFTTFPSAMAPMAVTTPAGDQLRAIVMNLTGGARPGFDIGFANPIHSAVWSTFGGDGTINGILNKAVTDTRDVQYQLDSDPAVSDAERAFNAQVYRVAPAADANPRRSDGVRWIPVVNGEFDVPVVTIHTLGDIYVPFSMQQIYRKRAEAKGNGERLVQRAIRGGGHCEFTVKEQTDAFDALTKWEQEGVKPAGDDVLTPATVASPSYGCTFTTVPGGSDAPTLPAARAAFQPCQ